MQEKLTSKEAAKFLGVQPDTLKVWRYRAKGPTYHKVGNKIIYYRKDLEKFIKRVK